LIKRYTNSFKHSKIDNPNRYFDECRLIEFFPLQLQKGDNALDWVRYANALRGCAVAYSGDSTNLPLPLHYAKLLEEYLDIV